ncbi:MAG TPA: hypothetical protein VG389_09365 [Myxococcota bacterium]|nr:hypothetical protein [Myxococcota bacterium]
MSAARRPSGLRVRPGRAGGSFNWVTLVLLLVAAATVYAAWKFLPPWWQQFEVKSALGEIAFKARGEGDEKALGREVEARLSDLGVALVDPPTWQWTDTEVHLRVHYRVAVVHPGHFLAPTILDFTPEASVPRSFGTP